MDWYTVGSGRGSNKFNKGKGKGKGTQPLPVHLHNQFVPLQPDQQHQQLHGKAATKGYLQQLQPGLQPQQHLQQLQQPGLWQAQQQQHLQQCYLPDWWCTECHSQHPYYHKVCRLCEVWKAECKGKGKSGKAKGNGRGKGKAQGKGSKPYSVDASLSPKQRPGRWRSGTGSPAHWKDSDANIYDMSYEDDDDEIMTNDEYDEEPEIAAEEVNRVLLWLKKKQNGSSEVVDVLDRLHISTKDEAPSKTHTDPWRALQSVKYKLKNIQVQADAASTGASELRGALAIAEGAREDLLAKKSDLEVEAKDLQREALSSMSNMKPAADEALHCERIVQELRQLFQQGLPSPQSQESARSYRLLYGDAAGNSANELNSSTMTGETLGSPAMDTHFGVDAFGATFGPSKGSKSAQSPYAKGPDAAESGATGKGVGLGTAEH